MIGFLFIGRLRKVLLQLVLLVGFPFQAALRCIMEPFRKNSHHCRASVLALSADHERQLSVLLRPLQRRKQWWNASEASVPGRQCQVRKQSDALMH